MRRSSRANMGKAWEQRLEAWHARYRANGHACIFPTPPKVKVLSMGRGGRFTGCFAGDGPPDYTGIAGGMAVTFDAKSTKADRWPLGSVSKGQAQHLSDALRCGSFAFIALDHPSGLWVLPWDSLEGPWRAWAGARGRAQAGTASLTAEQIEAMGFRFGVDGWLDAVLEAEP